MSAPLSPAAASYLLAFADDEHMVGARHTAWIGRGPFLEEDLAFCSIAQDELGHALALYGFLVGNDQTSNDQTSNDQTRAIDHFALLRQPEEYRSCAFAELECSDWQDALVRHWLYDRAEELRWGALVGSNNRTLSEIALCSQREESFHRAHAASFMSRIAASGDQDSVDRVSEAITRLLPIALGIWTPSDTESDAISEGFATQSSPELAMQWRSLVLADLKSWGLPQQWPEGTENSHSRPSHSRLTRSEGFGEFLASLQEVISIDPSATW